MKQGTHNWWQIVCLGTSPANLQAFQLHGPLLPVFVLLLLNFGTQYLRKVSWLYNTSKMHVKTKGTFLWHFHTYAVGRILGLKKIANLGKNSKSYMTLNIVGGGMQLKSLLDFIQTPS
jgi:hypothetical protein